MAGWGGKMCGEETRRMCFVFGIQGAESEKGFVEKWEREKQ